MKLTNVYNFPKSLVKAAEAFTRKGVQPRRTISVTQLIAPARIRHLEREHHDEIEEDVSERIWAVFGSAVHAILHEGHHLDDLSEEQLAWEFDGWTITGIPDLLEDGQILTDWKITSTYVVQDGAKDEWSCQLNVYAEMYRQYGFDVQGARIVAILRDWSEAKARRDPDYPQQKVLSIPVALWSSEEVKAYVRFRLVGHRLFEDGFGSVDCTAAERWANPPLYAVMGQGKQRALRVLPTHAEAAKFILSLPEERRGKLSIVARKATSRRCEKYCRVARWCEQWAQMQHELAPYAGRGDHEDEQPSETVAV